MASLNRVYLVGNLTKDPELKFIPSGTAVANLRMATNRRWKAANGEAKEEVTFVGVVVWGKQAEACGEYLKKGSPMPTRSAPSSRWWLSGCNSSPAAAAKVKAAEAEVEAVIPAPANRRRRPARAPMTSPFKQQQRPPQVL
jgi:single stranded DNA-binding protein